MALVIIAALLAATFFLLFKAFELRGIALFPAIAVNYLTAFLLGLAWSRPWAAGDLGLLWWPSAIEGGAYLVLFGLMGQATQRLGVAPAAVAAKLSLALTVLATMLLFGEHLTPMAWAGVALALPGVALSNWRRASHGVRGWWLLPVLFLGTAFTDTFLNAVQRTRTTPLTEASFTTLIFGFAALFSMVWLAFRADRKALGDIRTWGGGILLGAANYGSVTVLVAALGNSGLPASIIFPLLNLGVILFGAVGAGLFFRERLQPMQWLGIACSTAALVLLIQAVQ